MEQPHSSSSEPSELVTIVGDPGPDVPENGTEPSSSESSTTSKPLRYYKKFSQLEHGKKYKFFNRDLIDTSIINNFPFNSYVGTVDTFDIYQKLNERSKNDYISNRVYKKSGVRGDNFFGNIISGKLAKNHVDESIVHTIDDDDIYAYGKYESSRFNYNLTYLLLFRVYGIRPLISQISSAITGVLTRKNTGGKRKRRTHRRRRSNRRRRS